ncbi:MAG: rhodanese-like domain-containing protein [Prosthecobacter sp.]
MKSPSLFRRIATLLGWFLMAVLAASVGLWWFMNSERGAHWAQKVIRDRFPDVQGISPQELNAWLQDQDREGPPPLLIDVRTPEEQEVSTLRGARCVAPGDPAELVLEGLDHSRPVVVYCTAGFRAATMARRLMEAGRADVSNLEGGIVGWANAGFPVERDGIVVSKVHPNSSLFARMLKNREK